MIIKYFKKIKLDRGFTLLEALVAVSILMVAVVAPITISQKGLSSAVYTKNYMLASYLAQDAMEYIKNQRDFITINDENSDWDSLFIFNDCLATNDIGDKYCHIDTIDTSNSIKSGDGGALKIDTVNGFYGYGSDVGWEETDFTRKISIKLDPNGDNIDEALVEITVSWGSDMDNKVELYSLIYNY
jgi:type II secretory pathway pseudopilin PulG